MNYSNIKNCNQRQFNTTMKRECITVSDYYDRNKTYDVFFRRNRRGSNPQGKVRIYFSQDTPIDIGTTFVLKDDSYVVTSRDGDESDIFYTSLATKCDTELSVLYNGTSLVKIPIIVNKDEYTVEDGKVLSIIDGSVSFYTTDNEYSRAIKINDSFNKFGGYYKVGNTFYNNGLAYVYMTREAMPAEDRYILSYNGVTSLDMADATTYQLSYTAIKNDIPVDSPTLTYVSSDDTIATVDGNGLMTLLKEGNVTITATWTDGDNTTCETTIAITNGGVVPTTGTLTISGRTELKYGFPRKYTATYTDVNGNDVSSNYTSVWTITNTTFDTSKLTQTVNGNQITLSFDDETIIGETFTLNAVDSEGLFTPATMNINLVDVV